MGVFDNPCGDYLRAAIINYAADDNFVYRAAASRTAITSMQDIRILVSGLTIVRSFISKCGGSG